MDEITSHAELEAVMATTVRQFAAGPAGGIRPTPDTVRKVERLAALCCDRAATVYVNLSEEGDIAVSAVMAGADETRAVLLAIVQPAGDAQYTYTADADRPDDTTRERDGGGEVLDELLGLLSRPQPEPGRGPGNWPLPDRVAQNDSHTSIKTEGVSAMNAIQNRAEFDSEMMTTIRQFAVGGINGIRPTPDLVQKVERMVELCYRHTAEPVINLHEENGGYMSIWTSLPHEGRPAVDIRVYEDDNGNFDLRPEYAQPHNVEILACVSPSGYTKYSYFRDYDSSGNADRKNEGSAEVLDELNDLLARPLSELQRGV